MARLVRTQVEMEGRFEERWTLVEDDAAPEYADGERLTVVGHPHPRVSAAARLSGAARFISDITLPGMLHAAVLRSPHANARVASLDLDAPPRGPGRARGDRAGRHPRPRRPAGAHRRPGLRRRRRRRGRRRYARARPSGRSRRLRPPGSRSRSSSTSTRGSPARASPRIRPRPPAATSTPPSAAAAAVVDAEYRTPAQLQNPLEPHCAVAVWEAGGLTVWSRRRASSPPATSSPRRSTSSPTTCGSCASTWAAASAASRAPAPRASWRPSSPAAAAGRCGSSTRAARRPSPPATAPPRCRRTASAPTPTARWSASRARP